MWSDMGPRDDGDWTSVSPRDAPAGALALSLHTGVPGQAACHSHTHVPTGSPGGPARWPAGPALSELSLSGGSAWPCLPGHPSVIAPFSHLSDRLAD